MSTIQRVFSDYHAGHMTRRELIISLRAWAWFDYHVFHTLPEDDNDD